MIRLWTLLLILLPSCTEQVYAQAVYWEGNYNGKHYSQWYSENNLCCNNPACKMRQEILQRIAAQKSQFASAPSYSDVYSPVPQVQYQAPQVQYEMVPVTTRVKRCNGRTCWYEDVISYVRRPIPNSTSHITNTNSPNTVSYTISNRPSTTIHSNTLQVTELDPTPVDAVVEMLALVSPKENEVLYDLGCGDGRILAAATSAYNCRSVGIELNPESLEKAKLKTYDHQDKIRLYLGDILDFEYPYADIVTMYLYPDLMKKVLPKLKSGTRVVSYLHEIPGGNKVTIRDHTFYVWVKP